MCRKLFPRIKWSNNKTFITTRQYINVFTVIRTHFFCFQTDIIYNELPARLITCRSGENIARAKCNELKIVYAGWRETCEPFNGLLLFKAKEVSSCRDERVSVSQTTVCRAYDVCLPWGLFGRLMLLELISCHMNIGSSVHIKQNNFCSYFCLHKMFWFSSVFLNIINFHLTNLSKNNSVSRYRLHYSDVDAYFKHFPLHTDILFYYTIHMQK